MELLVLFGLAAIPAVCAVVLLAVAVYGCLYLVRLINIARRRRAARMI